MHITDQNFGDGIKILEATREEQRQAIYKCTQTLLQGLLDEVIDPEERENLWKSLEHLGIAEIKNLIAQDSTTQPPCNVVPFPQANQRQSRQTTGAGLFPHQQKRKD